MARFVEFKCDDNLKQIVAHAMASKQRALHLVHDDGVYLMSAGIPPNSTEDGKRHRVVYASGCDPKKDEDFYDNARDLVGGDDFVETIPLDKELVDAISRHGRSWLTIKLTEKSLSVSVTGKEA